MSDERQEIAQGQHAARILEDEIYRGAVDKLSEDLFVAWTKTKWHQVLKREFIYRQYRTIGEVETRLRAIMETGQIAAHNVEVFRKRDNNGAA